MANALHPLTPASQAVVDRWWPSNTSKRVPVTAQDEFEQRMIAMQIDLIERWRPQMLREHKERAKRTLKTLRARLTGAAA